MGRLAPEKETVYARLARGGCYGQLLQFHKSWRDVTHVLRFPAATPAQVFVARRRRVLAYAEFDRYADAVAECASLLRMQTLTLAQRLHVHFLRAFIRFVISRVR